MESGAGCLQCELCAGTGHRAPPGVQQREREFHMSSIDCTVKIALATIGQAPQARVRKRPSAAVFPEVLTVRGLTGTVLLPSLVGEESADEMAEALQKGISTDHRQRVQFVATDKFSGKMFVVLEQAVPVLGHCSCEHAVRTRLCSFQVCRSVMLRRLMSKFTVSQVHCPNVRFSCDCPFSELERVRWKHTRFFYAMLCLGLADRHAFRIRALS